MALKIEIKIIGLGKEIPDANYLIMNQQREIVETGTVTVPESGEVTINLSDDSSISEKEVVRITIDDFTGENVTDAGSATDWAKVEEVYINFSLEQNGFYVQCINQTGASTPWDMGDGTILTEDDPLYLYKSNGTYTITNAEFSEQVTITDVVLFNVSIVDNKIVCFKQSGIDGSWNFGNGDTSEEENPVYEYFANGDYTVTHADYSEDITIDFFTDMITSIDHNIVTFFIPEGASGEFNYGDKQTGTELLHEYAQAGRYIVEIDGMYDVVNIVADVIPVVGLNISEVDETMGARIITPYGASTYTLYVNDEELELSDGESITYDFTDSGPGTYTIRCVGLDGTGNAGTSEVSLLVQLENVAPVVTINAPIIDKLVVAFSCTATDDAGETLGYVWAFGDSSTSYEKNPTHTYVEAGEYEVTCTVYDDRENNLSTTENITINVSSDDSFSDQNIFMENNAELAEMNGDPNGLVGGFYYSPTEFVDGVLQNTHSNQTSTGRVQIEIGTLGLVQDQLYLFSCVAKTDAVADAASINYIPCGQVQQVRTDDGVFLDETSLTFLEDGEFHKYEFTFICTDPTASLRIYGTKDIYLDEISLSAKH